MPRNKPLVSSLLALIFALLGAAPAVAQEPSSVDNRALKAEIEKVLRLEHVAGSHVGVFAMDVETDQVIYDFKSGESFNPASNMKILTGAAALDLLGPDFVYVTRLSADKIEGDVVKGPLWVKSEGDPYVFYHDYLEWAIDLKERGITRIDGDLVIDDSLFGDDYTPPGYDQKDEDASYRAPIGAVSLSFNAVTVLVEPADEPGQKARVRMKPSNDYVEIVGSVTTTSGSRQRVQASATASGDRTRIELDGSIGANAATLYVRKRIDNPALFAGSAMKHAFEQLGIEVTGEVRRDVRPDNTVTLVRHQSAPLSYLVLLMNKWSNNFMAETIFRTLGRSEEGLATTEKARETVTRFLKKTGASTDGFNSFNGSGLYDGNQITPRQIVEVLDYMVDHPFYPEFAASLAIAGTDGTLRRRLDDDATDENLRGKTGTLNEVTALSGYVRTKSGRHVAYSILFDDTSVRAWRLRRVQDTIAEAIASFDG